MKKTNLFLLMLLAGAHLTIEAADDAQLARILEISAQEEAERQREEAQFAADLQAILAMEASANSGATAPQGTKTLNLQLQLPHL